MTRTSLLMTLSLALAIAAVANTAEAQFRFGPIKFGGSNRGGSQPAPYFPRQKKFTPPKHNVLPYNPPKHKVLPYNPPKHKLPFVPSKKTNPFPSKHKVLPFVPKKVSPLPAVEPPKIIRPITPKPDLIGGISDLFRPNTSPVDKVQPLPHPVRPKPKRPPLIIIPGIVRPPFVCPGGTAPPIVTPIVGPPVVAPPVVGPPTTPDVGEPGEGYEHGERPNRERSELERVAEQAKRALRDSKYDEALQLANRMTELAPNHGGVLQFRAAVYLGQTKYAEASIDAYNALLLGPIWTMSNIKDVYGSPRAYRRDVEWLADAAETQPDVLAHQFLNAYHAMIRNDWKTSETHLTKMLELKPGEPVATKLLERVQGELDTTETPEQVAKTAAK